FCLGRRVRRILVVFGCLVIGIFGVIVASSLLVFVPCLSVFSSGVEGVIRLARGRRVLFCRLAPLTLGIIGRGRGFLPGFFIGLSGGFVGISGCVRIGLVTFRFLRLGLSLVLIASVLVLILRFVG